MHKVPQARLRKAAKQAKLHGVGEQVSAITAAATRGELNFKQSFTQRIALLINDLGPNQGQSISNANSRRLRR